MLKAIGLLLAGWPLWSASQHFFHASQPLTPASAAPPRAIAEEYLRALAPSLELTAEDLAGLYVAKEYRTAHNGVTHLVYKQQFQGIEVYNAEWTVNIDRDGRVINAGGVLYNRPGEDVAPPGQGSGREAVRAAVEAVRRKTAAPYLPFDGSGKTVLFASAGFADQVEGQPVWYAVNGMLRPAWIFYVLDDNGIDNYATVVEDTTRRTVGKENLTLYQNPPRGLVFERESPQPNPKPGVTLTAPPPYVERTMQPFAGDLTASPAGWVSGTQTAGNNVIAAPNPMGVTFLATAVPISAPNRDFSFPLELGPGAPNPVLFVPAATANLFYWANRAHDFFYQIGFDEAAGNFQQDNFGRGGVGGDPMRAFSQFGSAANSFASLNNAFFTTSRAEDGARVSINMYVGGSQQANIFSDGSYDAQVILHEYTHGVSTRLVRQLSGFQGGAMGEAWSDLYSLEFTLPEGANPNGNYPQGEYLFQNFGLGIRTRPYSTNMDVNPLTYAALSHVTTGPEVHADGEIWMESLWDMRANLIQQFGEKEGRRRVRLLVIDGMKLSPPSPSMVDMRDAILLADRVDFNGASQDQIWSAFAKRGLGVLAQSVSSDSVHILASFEKPSPTGSMRFYDSSYVLGETVRIVLQDSNNTQPTVRIQLNTSSGDLENLVLRRAGSVFTGSMRTSNSGSVTKFNGALEVIPADFISAYYVDADAGGGAFRLIQATVPAQAEYTSITSTGVPLFLSGTERPLVSIPSGVRTTVGSIVFTLPFQFPFFGNRYSRVRVYGDGLLSFDIPSVASCYDRAGLEKTIGIAPMWMNLAYGGSAQPNENIYVSTGPGSVTFRWAAETQPFLSTFLTPEPVNFSATLFDDGRIQFQYGAGNRNLADSFAFAPFCAPSAPTAGISNGHESYSLVAPFQNARPNLENAPTVRFEPPFGFSSFPVVNLESPVENEHYRGVLTVSGIAYDNVSVIPRLDVLIDGVPRTRTSVNTSRPDFCSAQQVRNCTFVGFSTNLNLETLGLAPGAHTIQIRATNSRGAFVNAPEQPLTFFVDPGQSRLPVGAIEAPADGAELSGNATVRGYVYAADLRILSVDVMIDGVTYGPAAYGATRNDICGALTPRPVNCPGVGFTFTLSTTGGFVQLPNGKHTLQVRARDETGRYTLIPETPLNITVNNPVNQAPTGVLVAPRPNETLSGTVHVSGHAWDPDGRVTSVSLLVDGSSLLALRYGLPRPEECTQLPNVSACPNIGFEGDFDTRLVSNGPHAFGIRIVDNQGASTIVPALIRFGMNVVIEN